MHQISHNYPPVYEPKWLRLIPAATAKNNRALVASRFSPKRGCSSVPLAPSGRAVEYVVTCAKYSWSTVHFWRTVQQYASFVVCLSLSLGILTTRSTLYTYVVGRCLLVEHVVGCPPLSVVAVPTNCRFENIRQL